MQLRSSLVSQFPGWDFHPQEVFQEQVHGMACELDYKRACPPRGGCQGKLCNRKRNCKVAMGENTENMENEKSISKLEESIESSSYCWASPLLLLQQEWQHGCA